MGGIEMNDLLPFSAVVGQDDAKLALLLAAVERRIGGVVLRGEKGSAKSTLARGLAALLPGSAPFVDLPIGATEDRVIGSLDIAGALTGGEIRFSPGLLAAAHGGVLYVDEINLLPDHLVDALLDAAASGVNRVEREGISHAHPSEFLLIGSMNPEEGDLRPQLLDRFGLAVEVRTPVDSAARTAAVRRRLAFDADPVGIREEFAPDDAVLAARLAAVQLARLPDDLLAAISEMCVSVGAEGLRADLTICRAAAALAGWEGQPDVSAADVRRVAPLALAHRARRDPLEAAGLDAQRLDEALEQHLGPSSSGGEDRPPVPPGPATTPPIGAARGDRRVSTPASGRRSQAHSPRGRLVGDRPAEPGSPIGPVAVTATVREASARRGENPLPVERADLRQAIRREKTANLVVIAVDASGSMGAQQRMEAAKGAVLGLLRDAYVRRDLVALVTFRDDRGEVLLKPTGSVEVAKARLAELPTGGRTPLAAGIRSAVDVALAPSRRETHRPLVVLVTDGRATAGPDGQDPLAAAREAAVDLRRRGLDAVVVDAEGGSQVPLGLAATLAEDMGARYVRLAELTATGIEQAVRLSER
jgi:magnesium chelatase subunit D